MYLLILLLTLCAFIAAAPEMDKNATDALIPPHPKFGVFCTGGTYSGSGGYQSGPYGYRYRYRYTYGYGPYYGNRPISDLLWGKYMDQYPKIRGFFG
nr:unnamed protein product [Haemonchus contortus]